MASIELRYENAVLDACEDAWNESVHASVTASADTAVKKGGVYSAKFVCLSAGLDADEIMATEALTSVNIADMKGLVCWVRCTLALSAGDIRFLLDDTANCANPLETIDVPAVAADTWTQVFLPFVTPANLTAVISMGLVQHTELANFTFYIDDIRTYNSLTFDRALAVRGANRFDSTMNWPGSFEQGMDGSSYDFTTAQLRKIYVDLGVVEAVASQNFINKWLTKNFNKKHFSRYIVYSSEVIAVTLPDNAGYENTWLEDSELGRDYEFYLQEQTPQSTIPSSWS